MRLLSKTRCPCGTLDAIPFNGLPCQEFSRKVSGSQKGHHSLGTDWGPALSRAVLLNAGQLWGNERSGRGNSDVNAGERFCVHGSNATTIAKRKTRFLRILSSGDNLPPLIGRRAVIAQAQGSVDLPRNPHSLDSEETLLPRYEPTVEPPITETSTSNSESNGRASSAHVSRLGESAAGSLESSRRDDSWRRSEGDGEDTASVSGSERSQRGEEDQKYVRELEVATQAVQLACLLSQRIQQDILRDKEQAKVKKDKSLVTVADYGVQAVISYILSQAFPNEPLSMVAEESTDALKGRDEAATLRKVVDSVNRCLRNSPLVELPIPSEPLTTIDVLKAINRGAHKGGGEGRFWILDPVDGTLGFVRGDQYAVALALVEGGEIVLGVLGCPNLPLRKEWMRFQHRFYRAAEAFFPPPEGLWHKGIIFRARKGGGGAWAEPIVSAGVTLQKARAQARQVSVSPVTDPAKATFCEPVEKANSNQSLTAGLAAGLGISSAPLRAYSMAKYGMLAKGDAEIFMKFARGDYKEKIWDHAAGCFIVQEAGGVVTDAGGRPLDFSQGRFLLRLDRGIIASCNPSLHRRLLAALDASYNSSTL